MVDKNIWIYIYISDKRELVNGYIHEIMTDSDKIKDSLLIDMDIRVTDR